MNCLKEKNGSTALMLVVIGGDLNILELSLARKPTVNLKDVHGTTALMLAENTNNEPIVKILHQLG